ncbi:MAG: hypothetical protein SGCHY_001602 [Lobulomycetales sp.]
MSKELFISRARRASVTPHDVWPMMNKEPMERIISHRFDADSGWTQQEGLAKMQSDAFAKGAMRECYRLKKIPQVPGETHLHAPDWTKASCYVAKCFLKESPESKEIQFKECEMQVLAKSVAAAYNTTVDHCPRKIDFLSCFIIEFPAREGSPTFSVERFIEGEYVKHNTNSGFVDEKFCRLTPQCFSHFSYVQSQGESMIVDIQGVNDLYTDPQIHTRAHKFGDGDLGVRGMALFLDTHKCNNLCKLYGLDPFEKTPFEHPTVIRARTTVDPLAEIYLHLAIVHVDDESQDSAAAYLQKAISLGHRDATLVLAQIAEDLPTTTQISGFQTILGLYSTSDLKQVSSELAWECACALGIFEALLNRAQYSINELGDWETGVSLLKRALDLVGDDQLYPMKYQAEFLLAKAYKSGLGGLHADESMANDLLSNVIAAAIEEGELQLCKQAEKLMLS